MDVFQPSSTIFRPTSSSIWSTLVVCARARVFLVCLPARLASIVHARRRFVRPKAGQPHSRCHCPCAHPAHVHRTGSVALMAFHSMSPSTPTQLLNLVLYRRPDIALPPLPSSSIKWYYFAHAPQSSRASSSLGLNLNSSRTSPITLTCLLAR